jgi:protease I
MSSNLPLASRDKPLRGEKIAILAANGFDEAVMMESMRALADTGATLCLIGMDAGLVQGWTGQGFGHSHAADMPLSGALAADFSLLLVPSGQRAMDKLKSNPHTTRFLKGFLSYGNPLALLGDAVQLLAYVGQAQGRHVTGPTTQEAAMVAAGAHWSVDAPIMLDGALLTGRTESEVLKDTIAAMVAHFTNIPAEMRLAA